MNIKKILVSLLITTLFLNTIQPNDSIIQELKSISFIESTIITLGIAACYIIRKSLEPTLPKIDQSQINICRGINCLPIQESSRHSGFDYAMRHSL